MDTCNIGEHETMIEHGGIVGVAVEEEVTERFVIFWYKETF